MKISSAKVNKLCKEKKLNLNRMLADAGVSRNAYYSLLRKESILPKSITAIANYLEVSPAEFLESEHSNVITTKKRYKQAEDIHNRHKWADMDNIVHTLLLLEEPPIERLRRALLRGRQFNFQQ